MPTMREMIENPSLVTFIPASQERLDGIIAASKFIDSDEFKAFWARLRENEDEDDEEDWW